MLPSSSIVGNSNTLLLLLLTPLRDDTWDDATTIDVDNVVFGGGDKW
jgi:hypothetical protein